MEKNRAELPMHIAFCSDANYVAPTGIAIISICENNRDAPIMFHIVLTDSEESEGAQNAVRKMLQDIVLQYNKQLTFYTLSSESLSTFICKGSSHSHVSTTAFARLFLPQLLPLEIAKLIYFDCDIVITQSLKSLWAITMPQDCPLAAVPDCDMNNSLRRHQCMLPDGVIYFNSGVLLMNLDVWRKEHLTEQCVSTAIKYKFPLLDQDTINYVLQNRILRLPFTYNGQTLLWYPSTSSMSVDMQAYEEICKIKETNLPPIVLHYVTANKPWRRGMCPWREEWTKYKSLSIWKDMKLQSLVTSFDKSEIYPEFIDAYWGDPELMQLGVKSMLPFYYACLHFKNKRKLFQVCFSPIKWMTWMLEKIYRLKVKCSSTNR